MLSFQQGMELSPLDLILGRSDAEGEAHLFMVGPEVNTLLHYNPFTYTIDTVGINFNVLGYTPLTVFKLKV